MSNARWKKIRKELHDQGRDDPVGDGLKDGLSLQESKARARKGAAGEAAGLLGGLFAEATGFSARKRKKKAKAKAEEEKRAEEQREKETRNEIEARKTRLQAELERSRNSSGPAGEPDVSAIDAARRARREESLRGRPTPDPDEDGKGRHRAWWEAHYAYTSAHSAKSARDVLAQMMKAEDSEVRQKAILALAELGAQPWSGQFAHDNLSQEAFADLFAGRGTQTKRIAGYLTALHQVRETALKDRSEGRESRATRVMDAMTGLHRLNWVNYQSPASRLVYLLDHDDPQVREWARKTADGWDIDHPEIKQLDPNKPLVRAEKYKGAGAAEKVEDATRRVMDASRRHAQAGVVTATTSRRVADALRDMAKDSPEVYKDPRQRVKALLNHKDDTVRWWASKFAQEVEVQREKGRGRSR